MRTRVLIRIVMLVLLSATAGIGEFGIATAAVTPIPLIQVTGSDVGSRFALLGVSKSVVVDLPRDGRVPTIPSIKTHRTLMASPLGRAAAHILRPIWLYSGLIAARHGDDQ